jgi:HPt (histidine-containing phosphotransfer) domain-containing protein
MVRFCESQADGAEQIRRALDAGDRETAARIAHTLKGLAGTIGAERVAKTAAHVETHLRHGQDDAAQANLPVLADELHELVQRIEESLPALIEPPPSHDDLPAMAGAPQQAELLAGLDRLRELLEEDDGDAGLYLARQQAALAELGLARQADELRSLIARYRFDEALGALATLRHDLEATDRLSAAGTTKESL